MTDREKINLLKALLTVERWKAARERAKYKKAVYVNKQLMKALAPGNLSTHQTYN